MLLVSFINMKGGVGKTTLAVNVAYGLAYFHDLKALIVDCDPQFNATQYLLDDETYLKHINNSKKGTLREIFVPKHPGTVNTVRGKSRGTSKSKMDSPSVRARYTAIRRAASLTEFPLRWRHAY